MRKIIFYLLSVFCIHIGFALTLHAQHTEQQLMDSLILSFSFDHDSGFYAQEKVSGQRTAETHFGAMFKNDGLYLDGTDDELMFPKSEITGVNGTELSLCAWIKMDGTKGKHTILSKFFAYELKVIDGYLHFSVVVDGFKYFKAETQDSCIFKNQLHHIAAIRNQENITFFVDGKEMPVNYLDPQTTANLYPANNDIYIGSGRSKEWVDGIIYQVSAYKLGLKQLDIESMLTRNDIPNISPVADPGPDIICYPDIEFIALKGSFTDYYDNLESETWQQVYGNALSITEDTIWKITPGEYHFKYSVTDSSGLTDSKIKTIQCYPSSTAILFVAPYGDDENGTGTRNAPFASINEALNRSSGAFELIIHLLPGTYILNEQVQIPDKVSVIGSGTMHTLLTPHSNLFGTSKNLDNSLILLKNIHSGSSIGNFKIDGLHKQLSIGIGVKSGKNLILKNIEIANTYYSAIGLVDISYSDISHVKLVNTSWGNSDYSAGAIMIGDAEHVNLHHLNISEGLVDKPDLWGYGIKGFQIENSTYLKHVRIFDSKIETRNEGFWNNGEAPNMSIEFHSVSFDSCEIFNVEVNSTISLVPKSYTENSKNMRLHHCKIHSPKGVPVESYMINCEIDHNYILGEYSTIKGFNNNLYSEYLVHHNVFSDRYPKVGASQAMSYGALENVQFYNNTVHYTQFNNLTALELFAGASSGFDIANNIFYAHDPGTSKVIGLKNDATISNVQMRNNVLYNFSTGASVDLEENTFTDNPAFVMTASEAYTIPIPHDTSYVVDAGIDVGLPFLGLAPDIGAGESKVGFGNPPSLDILSPQKSTTVALGTNINISVNATVTDGAIDSMMLFINDQLQYISHTNEINTNYTFAVTGIYQIKVYAIDQDGLMATKSIQINVNQNLADLDFSQSGPIYLNVGQDTSLQLIFTPADASNQVVKWESNNTNVATVNQSGVVSGLSAGESIISIHSLDGGVMQEIIVKVNTISETFNHELSSLFSIYPNPIINNTLIIQPNISLTEESYHVIVYEVSGRVIIEKELSLSGKALQVMHLNNTSNSLVLYVKIVNQKGDEIYQNQFLKLRQ